MIPEHFIWVAVLLGLWGQILYIKSILRGHAKPNIVSWVIWIIAPFIGVFFQLKAGAGLSVLPIFMAGFGPLTIVLVATFTKNAIWKITPFDLVCGAFSLVALLLYIFTHNLAISVLFAILSDTLAFVPTFVKGWKFPESEYHSAYSFPVVTNSIGLLVIKDWSFTIASFGIYFVIANAAMMLILYRKKIFKNF